MNLETLNVTKKQAAEAVVHYRREVKLRRNAEDEAILRGYNQVLKGRKLIELSKVIAAGGVDEKRRPRLAIIGAAERACFLHADSHGAVRFGPENSWHWRLRGRTVSLPEGTLPRWPAGSGWMVEARAIVPLIPPRHRPTSALTNFHILFEAEWSHIPPRDPALLRHLGGDLWAVLAVWNLTDLERAVLAGRASS